MWDSLFASTCTHAAGCHNSTCCRIALHLQSTINDLTATLRYLVHVNSDFILVTIDSLERALHVGLGWLLLVLSYDMQKHSHTDK